jgi:hypothetical protein
MLRAIAGLRFAPAEHAQPAEVSAKRRLQAVQTVARQDSEVEARAANYSKTVARFSARFSRKATVGQTTLPALRVPDNYA